MKMDPVIRFVKLALFKKAGLLSISNAAHVGAGSTYGQTGSIT